MRLPLANLDVSPLSFGTGDLGTWVKGDDANRLFDLYAELGGNLLDTAHCYAFWVPGHEGASERAVGDWMRSRGARDRVLVSTKGGHPPMEGYPHRPDFLSAESIAEDVAESLERLGTDRIDLYYLHRDDGATPVDEIVDALNDQPELRFFGASNWSVARVLEANAYAARVGKRGFCALQNQWSLAVPNWGVPVGEPSNKFVTTADRDACAAAGMAVHAYSATATGYFEKDADEGQFAGNGAVRERARALATRLGRTPNQVALAWLLAQPGRVTPILGTKNPDHLRDAFAALDLRLSPEERDGLRA